MKNDPIYNVKLTKSELVRVVLALNDSAGDLEKGPLHAIAECSHAYRELAKRLDKLFVNVRINIRLKR